MYGESLRGITWILVQIPTYVSRYLYLSNMFFFFYVVRTQDSPLANGMPAIRQRHMEPHVIPERKGFIVYRFDQNGNAPRMPYYLPTYTIPIIL